MSAGWQTRTLRYPVYTTLLPRVLQEHEPLRLPIERNVAARAPSNHPGPEEDVLSDQILATANGKLVSGQPGIDRLSEKVPDVGEHRDPLRC